MIDRIRRNRRWYALVPVFVCCFGRLVTGAEHAESPWWGVRLPDSLPMPTLGGTQFWTDQHFCHQWKIQRRAGTTDYRLLDGFEWHHAQGSFGDCLAKLEEIKREKRLEPMQGKAVILLHGLGAPAWSMRLLGNHLNKVGGYEIFNMEYASTRCSIDEHAQSLASVVRSLAEIDELNLVGHSMGNIVIRRYLAGQAGSPDGWTPDPRIHRIVMIAPPNHGSSTATEWADKGLFKAVFGKAGQQLGVEWAELETRLATPTVEFGIIAGGKGNDEGFSRGLPGDDDGRIELTTTRLAGARDFIVVPMFHELIANDPRVFDYTANFLQSGAFVSPERRQPVTEQGRRSPRADSQLDP